MQLTNTRANNKYTCNVCSYTHTHTHTHTRVYKFRQIHMHSIYVRTYLINFLPRNRPGYNCFSWRKYPNKYFSICFWRRACRVKFDLDASISLFGVVYVCIYVKVNISVCAYRWNTTRDELWSLVQMYRYWRRHVYVHMSFENLRVCVCIYIYIYIYVGQNFTLSSVYSYFLIIHVRYFVCMHAVLSVLLESVQVFV